MSDEKYLLDRKFWIFLPVLIVPIITIFFWLMGGGRVVASSTASKKGLNTQLPNANVVKDSAKDKLAFYQAADVDSSKRVEQMRMDPYRKDTVVSNERNSVVQNPHEPDMLEMKIASIRRQVAASGKPEKVVIETEQVPTKIITPDPELEAINGTLDKLMAIQHPQQINSRPSAINPAAFAVNSNEDHDTTYIGKRTSRKIVSSFYNDVTVPKAYSSAISGIIPTEQILQNGSLVKIELRSSVSISNIILPVGTNVFGIAALDGERLIIKIPSIRFQNSILPVALTVYDLDGLEGIYIPGSLSRDVAKSTADNAIQSAGISGLDLSLKTQAAVAGIGAAKSLLSKKVKQVRVVLSSGYQVLLRDTKQNEQ